MPLKNLKLKKGSFYNLKMIDVDIIQFVKSKFKSVRVYGNRLGSR